MKLNFLTFILLSSFSTCVISEERGLGLTHEQSSEMNEIIKEIKANGIKPTDSNIFNICYASSLLILNAANDAVSGVYDGDRGIGEVLLIPHDEYKDIVRELVKSDSVYEIRENPEKFDSDFQMKCRASPDIYVKKYKHIFR